MKKVTTLLLAAIILASCGNVLDKKFDLKTAKDDYAKIKEKYKDKYTQEELDALSNEMGRQVFGGGTATYREMLDTIHAEKLRYDADLKEYQKKVDAMNNVLQMKIDTAALIENYYGTDIYAVRAGVLNKQSKVITGIKGKFIIYDIFGKKIHTVYVERTGTVKQGEDMVDGEVSALLSGDNKTALRETPFSKIKWEWLPEVIVFDDGTKMEAGTKPANPLKDPFED